MPSIFISYRRSDNPYAASGIYEGLKARFGESSVTFDVDSFPMGIDFRCDINARVSDCDVMLAIIGNDWLSAVDAEGKRRIDDPADFVHIEVSLALQLGKHVIPVLVEAATIPSASDLPEPLQELSYRNAAEVRAGAMLQSQLQKLIDEIEELLRRTASPAATLGSRLLKERYVIEDELDWGGMGRVFKALDRISAESATHKPYVTIKMLDEGFTRDVEASRFLHREASQTRANAHPNILTVFDFGRDGDTVFLIMEYVEGNTLDKIFHDFPNGLDQEDADRIIGSVCGALLYAHENGFVHSDLNPGNIYVTKDGVAKVMDFGISLAASVVDPGTKRPGRTKFDPSRLDPSSSAYASLEVLQNDMPREADDVYSLACVAYQTLTGKHPYAQASATVALAHGMKPVRIPGISTRKWRALERALNLESIARTSSVAKFRKAYFGDNQSIRNQIIAVVVAMLVVGSALVYILFFASDARTFAPDRITAIITYDFYLGSPGIMPDAAGDPPVIFNDQDPWEMEIRLAREAATVEYRPNVFTLSGEGTITAKEQTSKRFRSRTQTDYWTRQVSQFSSFQGDLGVFENPLIWQNTFVEARFRARGGAEESKWQSLEEQFFQRYFAGDTREERRSRIDSVYEECYDLPQGQLRMWLEALVDTDIGFHVHPTSVKARLQILADGREAATAEGCVARVDSVMGVRQENWYVVRFLPVKSILP